MILIGFSHERRRRRWKTRREKERARKRDREEERRRKNSEERGAPSEPERSDPEPDGKPSDSPVPKIEEGGSGYPVPSHTSLPDGKEDGYEPPSGITPEEAKELHLKGSPVGVSFEARGNSTTALGNSYSDAVNTYVGAQRAPPTRDLGSSEPDGMINSGNPKKSTAVEAKYVESWADSLYNPDLEFPFPHETVQETVAQAVKYSKAYPAGVNWYTNSIGFVRAYGKKFKEAGIENFTFTIIPAARIRP